MVTIELTQGRSTILDDRDLGFAAFKWYLSHDGYAVRNVPGDNGKKILLHRAILGLTDPKREVDHINGDKLDNRRSNLRVVDQEGNQQNQRGLRRDNRSGYRGVTWHRRHGKWQAQARANGRLHHLGLFDDVDEAGRLVAAFRAEHMPYSPEARA